MNTNEKQNNPQSKGDERRAVLSPQQIQRRRKMVIYPLFVLAFLGCLWLILPHQEKDEPTSGGFNPALPSPQEENIISDKREAYEQEAMQQKERERLLSLEELSLFTQEDSSNSESEERTRRQERMASKPVEYYEQPSRFSGNGNPYRASASAYADVKGQLGSFYQSTELSTRSREQELRDQIAELERRLDEKEAQQQAGEKELALIEKSYEIASRYMGGGSAAPNASERATNVNPKVDIQPVRRVPRNVVSRLAAPVPDSVLGNDSDAPRNMGFITAEGNASHADRNSIRACVYCTVTIKDGGEISLRLLDAMMVGDYFVPENTVITGTCAIDGQRLTVEISTVQHEGNILPVKLQVYDLDGMQGINVPGSDEINAAKEIAANMGSGLGSSITISDDAGSQLLSDLGRSAIQGVSQYASNKVREVKVTLKEGYQVLLTAPLK